MAVPDFQSLMLPLLKLMGDGRERTQAEAREGIAPGFGLSDADRQEMLTSGTPRYNSNVSWALTYLKHAGLLESPGRGRYRITTRGRDVLRHPPDKINIQFLTSFPEFITFAKTRQVSEKPGPQPVLPDIEKTPEEALEATYQAWRQSFSTELLERVKSCSPGFFERMVIDLLLAMGYGGSRRDAAEAVGRSGDEGIDGIIKEDRLGLDVVYVQAKRWQSTVGRPNVQTFAGSLVGQNANKGIFITTSDFSREAREYAARIAQKIVLIAGVTLADLMIDHGIGVSDVAAYTIKRIDSDYFDNE